jgi:hypothetical protein
MNIATSAGLGNDGANGINGPAGAAGSAGGNGGAAGASYRGGLVAWNSGTISNSFANNFEVKTIAVVDIKKITEQSLAAKSGRKSRTNNAFHR